MVFEGQNWLLLGLRIADQKSWQGKEAFLRPGRTYLRSERTDLRLERPKRAYSWSETADFGPERTC